MPFMSPSSVDVSALRWVRTATGASEYELRAVDVPLARISWANEHDAVGTATTADGAWTVRRDGFLLARVHLRRVGEDRDVARLLSRREGFKVLHALKLAGGPSYALARAGRTVPAWSIQYPSGAELAHIEPIRDGSRLEGGLCEFEGPIVSDPSLLRIALLSWYFIALAWFEDEVTVEWIDHGEAKF
ncbi:MAG: hypothetical protein ACREBT_05595 [Thermoplasmata archaeon]